MTDILVCGALHLDVIVDAPRLPQLDETLVGQSVGYRPGGKGANQAIAAARMGASVAMAGCVGRDGFGRQLLDALDSAGVDRTQVLVVPGASGMSVAIVDTQGNYGAVIVSGANLETRAEAIAILGKCRALVLQNEIPEPINLDLADRAPETCTVMLNAAPTRPTSAALLSRTDILIVNRVEAAMMIGSSAACQSPHDITRQLLALGPKAVILTLGEAGAFVRTTETESSQIPAFNVPVISTHGAGDAFIGALAARIAAGDALHDAASFACAAGAIHVSLPVAARDGISADQVRHLLASARTNG